ncbi:MAG TPA: L,D-transpeptidase [Xanthomonadales bacterium]|nr:L,D-transpeptidase [Xanthomonadales bacterium]
MPGIFPPVLTVILSFVSFSTWAGEVWVNVDTTQGKLYVMEGDEVLRTFENISIGVNGTTSAKYNGDKKTPLGSYRVRRINDESRFHLFFGVDYPTTEQAAHAYMVDQINVAELEAIYLAHREGREPPATTALGGAIGIHGIGAGDPQIHQQFNWTDGCVALTDQEIDELAKWVGLGTVVVIQASQDS